MSHLILVVFFVIAATGFAAAFTADVDLAGKNKLLDRFVVRELVVGDKAIIDQYSLCWRESELFVQGSYEVIEAQSRRFNLQIERVPGGGFDAEFLPPERVRSEDIESVMDALYSAGECDFVGAWNVGLGYLFPVNTINGVASVSALFPILNQMLGDSE